MAEENKMSKENKASPYTLLANNYEELEKAKEALDEAQIPYRVAWTNDPIPGNESVQLISGLMIYSGLSRIAAIARYVMKKKGLEKNLS